MYLYLNLSTFQKYLDFQVLFKYILSTLGFSTVLFIKLQN